MDEEKLKSKLKTEELEAIKKMTMYFPDVLRVEGERRGKTERLFFSKVLRVESEGVTRDFHVDNKYGWIYLGGDDSCFVGFPVDCKPDF